MNYSGLPLQAEIGRTGGARPAVAAERGIRLVVVADTVPDAWSRSSHGQVLLGISAGSIAMLATSLLVGR